MSSLLLSNDSLEGKVLSNLMNEYISRSRFPDALSMKLRQDMEIMFSSVHGLGFCLSEEMDMLSQWRAYADDGYGFCVGFSTNYFKALSSHYSNTAMNFTIQKVDYSDDEHRKIIEPIFQKMNSEVRELVENSFFDKRIIVESDLPVHYSDSLINHFINNLYRLKSAAFEEEREWRLINHHGPIPSVCDYRVAGRDRIVPYKSLPLIADAIDHAPILEVLIGPKNTTPPKVIEDLLEDNGFPGVDVLFSAASYR